MDKVKSKISTQHKTLKDNGKYKNYRKNQCLNKRKNKTRNAFVSYHSNINIVGYDYLTYQL